MEQERAKRGRNARLQALVLGTVAAAGIIAVGLMAPNALSGMKKLGLLPKAREREYITAARNRLKRKGLLIEQDGFLRLSKAGERELERMSLLQADTIPRPKRWDEKWRVLIFDIPERRKATRNRVRAYLVASGFLRAQDSVWIFPYPCEEFVALLKAECRIGRDMLYMIVDSIEHDGTYRNAFGLPRRR